MIRILTIGNSFAQTATSMMPQICAADGQAQIMVGKTNLGGCSLEKHCNILRQCELFPDVKPYSFARTGKDTVDATLCEALVAEPWDYVTLQQASRLSWRPETHEPFFGRLLDLVRKLAPQARPVVHQTWAYRIDTPFLAENQIDQAAMHAGIVKAYGAVARAYRLPILPVGAAFALACRELGYTHDASFDYKNPKPGTLPDQRHSLNVGYTWVTGNTPDPNAQFHMDGAHCTPLGHYLANAVWFEMFTGRGIVTNTFMPPQTTTEELAILKRAAHQAAIDAGGPIARQRRGEPAPWPPPSCDAEPRRADREGQR